MVIINGLSIISIIMATQLLMLIQYYRSSSNDDILKSGKADLKQAKSHKTSFAATFFQNTILTMCFGALFIYKFWNEKMKKEKIKTIWFHLS